MNREIKFRAWDTGLNDWLNLSDKWYITPAGNVAIHGETKNMIYPPMETKVLMQYTGLKDKNGKEIYEGDIVEIETNHQQKIKHLIAWSTHPYWGWRAIRKKDGGIPKDSKDGELLSESIAHIAEQFVEIIGNLYENPDLLT